MRFKCFGKHQSFLTRKAEKKKISVVKFYEAFLGSLNCYSGNSYSHFDDPFFDVGYMREVKKNT